jgi:hypothetical protein
LKEDLGPLGLVIDFDDADVESVEFGWQLGILLFGPEFSYHFNLNVGAAIISLSVSIK